MTPNESDFHLRSPIQQKKPGMLQPEQKMPSARAVTARWAFNPSVDHLLYCDGRVVNKVG